MIKKIIYPILTLVWMIIIYSLSAKTADVSGSESNYIIEWILQKFINSPSQSLIDSCEVIFRKLCHFGEYAVLSFFVYMSFRTYGFSEKKSALTILVCLIYAISDEIHQYFVPGRACRLLDIFIDTFGAIFTYFVLNIKFILRIE